MSVELRPLGVKCNIACQYCYQNMHRDANNDRGNYHLEKMKQAVLEEGGPFHLFGGEPLLMKLADLEEMFRWGLETFGENGVQTNGALITKQHIELFKKYKVTVGLSVDGPGELNDARWADTLEKTRRATQQSLDAIEQLCRQNHHPGIMLQLTRCNATAQRLPRLFEWVNELAGMGIQSIRVHILEIENPEVRKKYGLSSAENLWALRQFMELEKQLPQVRFDITTDMRDLLLGKDGEAPCVWRACDPYTTEAVTGVSGDGSRHNCGLTDKEGIDFQKPEQVGYERYIALYHTPQEYGGCQGCRFFLACKGHCPGTAIDRDWRNKTEYCDVWQQLFTQIEQELVQQDLMPISLHEKRNEWEQQMLDGWQCSDNYCLEEDVMDLSENDLVKNELGMQKQMEGDCENQLEKAG